MAQCANFDAVFLIVFFFLKVFLVSKTCFLDGQVFMILF